MEMTSALTSLSALAHETRLAVVRLLVAHEPEGLPAGEIARRAGCAASTLSGHLAILSGAGLIVSTRRGRSLIYRARMPALTDLVNFLIADCCGGDPALCLPAAIRPGAATCEMETCS
jgi:DNA-binding transcriptional ArsR family regulator